MTSRDVDRLSEELTAEPITTAERLEELMAILERSIARRRAAQAARLREASQERRQ
jgi:hypothetical protein